MSNFPEDPFYADDEDFITCDLCGGEGTIELADAGPGVWGEDCFCEENRLITCPYCKGIGRWTAVTPTPNPPTKETAS